jgi:hypothetical protein
MKTLRHTACVLLAAASLLASPAYATSFTADQSDLYYIVTEQGWGIQLVQRGTVIFATLFVYGPSGQPTWYTATMDYTSGLTWTGALYATTGTYFGAPWNPALLTVNPVGTMTWTAQTVDTGLLIYVVNGVTVVKTVTRQALVLDDFSGHYFGGVHDVVTGCPNPAANGTFDLGGFIDIAQSGAAVTIVSTGLTGVVCTYTGTLTEAGQMGAMNAATFSCSDGSAGDIALGELQVTPVAIGGTFAALYSNPPGCFSNGWLGGFRGTTF